MVDFDEFARRAAFDLRLTEAAVAPGFGLPVSSGRRASDSLAAPEVGRGRRERSKHPISPGIERIGSGHRASV